MAHLHSVYDTDSHFSIDKITRAIKNESSKKVTVMQFDHNSERFTFDLPRYIEGHDMSVCNLSEVHYQNGSTKGVYVIDDLQISPADNDVVICSWLISRNATQNAAALDFRLTFSCVSEEGKNEYEWNTGVHKGISVQGGIRNSEVIEEEYSDAIGYLNEKMNTAVLCVEQHLTEEQKAQVRDNIGVNEAGGSGSGMSAPPIVCNTAGSVITIDDSPNRMFQGLKIFGKTTQNGTPTPDAPIPLESVGTNGSMGVMVYGKNLLPNTAASQTVNGVDFVVNADGSVLVNGTAEELVVKVLRFELNKILPLGTCRVTGCPTGTSGVTLIDSYNGSFHDTGTGANLTVKTSRRDISIRIEKGTVCNNLLFKPMVSADLSATYDDYEPYKEPQTLTIQKPTDVSVFLPGIPVSSGGNYTDENGQQWICDEVDFVRGKYVQRCACIELTGGELWVTYGTKIYGISNQNLGSNPNSTSGCSHYKRGFSGTNVHYIGGSGVAFLTDFNTIDEWKAFIAEQYADGTPMQLLYSLATPVEYDLSPDELAQYAALHTNYPNTTIFNDGGADMEVQYVADTKLYIDKKFAELSTALLNQ